MVLRRKSLPSARLLADPRHYQIAVLAGLLIYGKLFLAFEITLASIALLISACQLFQWGATRWFRLRAFEPRSAFISSLSLCLLLRTDTLWLAPVAAALTILGKFLIRWRGKHIFNPTNFGLAAMMLFTDRVWVSPGQWGSAAFFGFLMACLGGLVVYRAARSDITYAFLLSYGAVLFGRAAWLGDPFAIPLHQIQNGAFLLFAFFMISDPRVAPDSRAGRILFACLVALGAGFVHFVLFRPNGLIWSLAFLSPLIPLIDALLPGPAHSWEGVIKPSGGRHENPSPVAAVGIR